MSRYMSTQSDKQLRVPRVTQEFFPVVSGPANQALALSRELERRGIASPILTTTTEQTREALAGVSVHRFRPILAAPNFRPSPALQRTLMREPATVLHVHGWRNPASDGAILAARRRGIPIVVQAHGVAYGHRYSREALPIRAARRAYDAVIRAIVTRAAAIVAASTQLEADELRNYGFPAEKIVVIPVGIDERFFAAPPERRCPSKTLTLLTVGRLSPLRNVDQMIHALALLRAWGIPARLRVVGPEVRLAAGEVAGYRQQLEVLARQLGIADAVTFTGPLGGDALLEEYRLADAFICTTLYENFGQPIAEAAAMGLPIVATPAGVAVDLLKDNRAGFLVPFHDASATAVALRHLCCDGDLRARLGQAARSRAATGYSWQQITCRYIELYEGLLT
jgi:glycosyltransferase involved in cell wall biosynthesis